MSRGLLRRVRSLAMLPFALPGLALSLLGPRRRDVVKVVLRGDVPAEPRAVPFLVRRLVGEPRTSLLEALSALHRVCEDEAVLAAWLELDRAGLSLAHAEELARAVREVRAAGKKVLVWADEAGAGALVVAAAADRAFVPQDGLLPFAGVRLAPLFLKGALERAGVVAEVVSVGPWKTAGDAVARRGLTPENEEMLAALAGDLHAQVVRSIARGRGQAETDVAAALDDAPVAHATAVERKLVDGLARRDELEKCVAELLSLGREPTVVPAGAFVRRALRRERVQDLLREPPVVAVVPLRGAILPGDEAPPLAEAVPSLALAELLDALREDQGVAAVVLWIDSPGGSATASEELWRAVRRLDERHPVVACLGRVAASGGYYVASAARRILAAEATITGSIGVIGGKLHAAPLLDRAGVAVGAVERGKRAGIFSPERGFTDEERDAIRREIDRFYERFLARVAEGRKKTREEVDAVGRGRVFTGKRALGFGLVDELGGIDRAVEVALELAGAGGQRPELALAAARPRRRSPLSFFSELATGLTGLGPVAAGLAGEHVLALDLTSVEGV